MKIDDNDTAVGIAVIYSVVIGIAWFIDWVMTKAKPTEQDKRIEDRKEP